MAFESELYKILGSYKHESMDAKVSRVKNGIRLVNSAESDAANCFNMHEFLVGNKVFSSFMIYDKCSVEIGRSVT